MSTRKKVSKLERSRGVDLTTGQADSAPNYSSGSSSVPVVKSTTGSRFLGLETFFRVLVYVLPGILFFSYQPLVHFGSSESMNFELSLPLIWLVVFDLLVVALGFRRRGFWKGILKHWVWLLLPLWLSLSVLWSMNALRGVLTVGILWLIYLAGYGFWSFRHLFEEVGFREKFWKAFFGSALVVCAWCFLQCVLDLCGVSREYSLMCAGCTYAMFGFPHPDGFAIEPQFMGNLLLAPAIISGWLMLMDGCNSTFRGRGSSLPSSRGSDPSYLGRNLRKPLKILLPVVLFSTLFLTFSRGAIYAFVVGAVVMCAWEGARQKSWRVLKLPAFVVGMFVLVLGVQGVMAAVSPTNDTFQSGVAKVLNHLTLGVVDVRGPEITEVEIVENPVENPDDGQTISDAEKQADEVGGAGQDLVIRNDVEEFGSDAGNTSAFDGYVAESTDTRLRLSGAAVEVWSADLKTAMFGVGLGGAGQALYVNGLSPAPKEIVQNQYVSLLMETGVVGAVLFVLTMLLVVRATWKSSWRVVLFSLIVAYMVSVCFFSGLPNALHIYLLPALVFAMSFTRNDKNKNILDKQQK